MSATNRPRGSTQLMLNPLTGDWWFLTSSTYRLISSMSPRSTACTNCRRTRATCFLARIMLHTGEDAQCDKVASVVAARSTACRNIFSSWVSPCAPALALHLPVRTGIETTACSVVKSSFALLCFLVLGESLCAYSGLALACMNRHRRDGLRLRQKVLLLCFAFSSWVSPCALPAALLLPVGTGIEATAFSVVKSSFALLCFLVLGESLCAYSGLALACMNRHRNYGLRLLQKVLLLCFAVLSRPG